MKLLNFFSKDGSLPRLEIDWKNQPSVKTIVMSPWMEGKQLVDIASNFKTDLIYLFNDSDSIDNLDLQRQIELSFQFNADRHLNLMFLNFNHCLIIRRAFLLEHSEELRSIKGSKEILSVLSKIN